MREIKFRGWDKKRKEMCRVLEIQLYGAYSKALLRSIKSGEIEEWRKINDMELLEFAGLPDKNGKEIYEGDIVAVKYSINRGQYSTYHDTQLTIKWNERKSGFYPFISWNDIEETEVIGNIFENKELLNDNKKTKEN